MVSLPAKWCAKKHLEKGEEVAIQETPDGLLVNTSEPEAALRKATYALTETTETAVRTVITNAYRTGIDQITLSFTDPRVVTHAMNTVTNNLLGFDVVSQSDKQLIIRSIAEPSFDQLDILQRKVFQNIMLLFDVLLGDKTQDSAAIEARIYQYDNFCRRVIYKTMKSDERIMRWQFMTLIIHAQRELYFAIAHKDEVSLRTRDLITEIRKLFVHIQDGFFKQSCSSLEQVHVLNADIGERIKDLLPGAKQDAVLLHHLAVLGRTLYLSSSPLLGLLLLSSASQST